MKLFSISSIIVGCIFTLILIAFIINAFRRGNDNWIYLLFFTGLGLYLILSGILEFRSKSKSSLRPPKGDKRKR